MKQKKVVFLDRDGVINIDPREKYYVHRWSEFKFQEDIFEAAKLCVEHEYIISIVSNQAGVGKGVVAKEDLDEITDKMVREFESHAIPIDSVNYCIHAPDQGCECRKPKTALFRSVVDRLNVKISESVIIGDSERDIEAGAKVGLKTILVLTGRSSMEDVMKFNVQPDYVARDAMEAVRWLIN